METSITHFNDCQLFSHQAPNEDSMIDMLPPTSFIGLDKFSGTYRKFKISDENYQEIFTGLKDRYDTEKSLDEDGFIQSFPNFGEGWLAAADHAAAMTGIDRMIFEDCHHGSGGVQRQGLNVPNIGKSRKIEVLAKELACTVDQAEDLMDFWKIIDDSGRLWPTFRTWVKKRSVPAALEYFEGLAGALVDDSVGVHDEKFSLIGDTFRPWENPEDQENGEEPAEDTTAEADNDELDDIAAATDDDLLESFLDRKGFTTPTGQWHYDPPFSTTPVFKYTNINFDGSCQKDFDPAKYSPITDRMTNPAKTARLLASIEKSRLAACRKAAVMVASKTKGRWMSYRERAIFWQTLNARKHELERAKDKYIHGLLDTMTAVEQASLTKIRNTKSIAQARFFWSVIYRAQAGELDMGRPGFIKFVLCPELNRIQDRLKKNKPAAHQQELPGYWESLLKQA